MSVNIDDLPSLTIPINSELYYNLMKEVSAKMKGISPPRSLDDTGIIEVIKLLDKGIMHVEFYGSISNCCIRITFSKDEYKTWFILRWS